MRRHLLGIVALSAFVSYSPAADDTTEKNLTEAKAKYDKSRDEARVALEKALTDAIAASQKKGDTKGASKLEDELKAFQEKGTPPATTLATNYNAQIKAARSSLEKAYKAASSEYSKRAGDAAGDEKTRLFELAKATDKEREEFLASNSGVSIFNGKDLSGWSGMPKLWAVKDGMIVGSTMPNGSKETTCLVSDKEYGDFELKCKVKLTGNGANSGIQVRSAVVDKKEFRVEGSQCDLANGYWGSLYAEGQGMLKEADQKALIKVIKDGEFNECIVRCVGQRITIIVNGVTTVDDTFRTLPKKGIIGWQLHKGKGMEVAIKDIEFKELSTK